MVSKAISDRHPAAIEAAVRQLQAFGALTAPPAPAYYGYLGTVTSAVLPLLIMAKALAEGGTTRVRSRSVAQKSTLFEMTDEQWQALMVTIHRAYYTNLAVAIEGLCLGYCVRKGASVTSGGADSFPAFGDYLNAALGASNLPEERKKHWRAYFDAVHILRNKSARIDTRLSFHEKEVLTSAGLAYHIDSGGGMHSNVANYAPLAQAVLDFVKELDASKQGPLPG